MSENLYIRTPSGNAPVTWSVCQTTLQVVVDVIIIES